MLNSTCCFLTADPTRTRTERLCTCTAAGPNWHSTQVKIERQTVQQHASSDIPKPSTHVASLASVFLRITDLANTPQRRQLVSGLNSAHVYFFVVNCLLLAVLAITTLRMKYLWSPYICILSSFAVTDYAVWRWIFPGKSSTKVCRFFLPV